MLRATQILTVLVSSQRVEFVLVAVTTALFAIQFYITLFPVDVEHTSIMENIKIISLNVNGLNISSKRRIIFDHLRGSGADLCLLKETHGTHDSATLWRKEWGAPAFFNNGSQSSRGTAILVSKKSSIDILQVEADDHGRVICMNLELDKIFFTVSSFYAPTQDKPREQLEALDDLEQTLLDLNSDTVIVGGDFNCFIDPQLDRNSHSSSKSHSEPVRDKIRTLLITGGYVTSGE